MVQNQKLATYQLPKWLLEQMRIVESAPEFAGAFVRWRADWEAYYFDLDGKMFALATAEHLVFKNTPTINEELRTQYPTVIFPGYHFNKTHWNHIDVAVQSTTAELPDEMITKLLQASYELVLAKLPKYRQAQIKNTLTRA